MKFHSILTNIKIGFTITFILFVFVFLAYLQHSHMQEMRHTANFYESIARHLHLYRVPKQEAIKYIQSLNFQLVREHRQILDNAKDKFGGRDFEVIKYHKVFYIHIDAPGFRILLKDLNSHEKNYYGDILFGILFIALIFIYLWIMRALNPLKSLQKEMQKFANGDLNINCKSDKKDEIAQLSNEFDNAVKKISLLINSRQLFLRTIMHELKTPIAKGRIVSELIDDEKQKKRIITIFEKLNLLINDFAKVEQIVSNNYSLNMYASNMGLIVNKAIDMLMLDTLENIVIQKNTERTFMADQELFALAIKNLLDNALKYSFENKVTVVINEESISFISKGEPLAKDLEEYYKPFHNETENKNHGMGLGIYIVHSILKLHNMKLEYRYQDQNNIFSIF